MDDDYKALRKAMKQRFSKKDEPVSARRQLQYVRQQDGESLGEFAERVHFLVMDGYDRCENTVIDQIGTEAFLRGCRDKESARCVIEKNPSSISKAVKLMKSTLANQKAIYGTRSPNFAHRQVSFQDTRKDTDANQQHMPLEKEVRNLTQVVTKLADLMISDWSRNVSPEQAINRYPYDRSPSPNFGRQRSPTPPRRPYNQQRRSPSPGTNNLTANRRDGRDSGFFRQRSPSPMNGYRRSTSQESEKPLNGSGSSQEAHARS